MKIAQALSLRKSQEKMLLNLIQTINTVAYDPDENPDQLITDYFSLAEKQTDIIYQIECANLHYTLDYKGEVFTLSRARLVRDRLIKDTEHLSSLPRAKKKSVSYGGSEVQTLQLDRNKLKTVIADFSRRARELDDKLQEANWLNELELP